MITLSILLQAAAGAALGKLGAALGLGLQQLGQVLVSDVLAVPHWKRLRASRKLLVTFVQT